jgi:hypothetical protein
MALYLQFQQAENLSNLLTEINPYLEIDTNQFWLDYFNIDTAKTFGLENWGRILDFSNDVKKISSDQVFGFDVGAPPTDPATGYPQNFDHGNFWSGTYTSITLTNPVYRIFLKLRFLVLHCNFSWQSIVNVMNIYAKMYNTAYEVTVTEVSNMRINFHFNYVLQSFEKYLFLDRKILPVPTGVSYTVTHL